MWFLSEELLGTPKVSPTDSIPAGFCSQKLWGLPSLALEPWARGPGMGQGLLASEISLLNFIHHTCVWDQFILCLHPSTSLDGCGFFNSIVVRLPFNPISDSSE